MRVPPQDSVRLTMHQLRTLSRSAEVDQQELAGLAATLLPLLGQACECREAGQCAHVSRGMEQLAELLRDPRLAESVGTALDLDALESIGRLFLACSGSDGAEAAGQVHQTCWHWLDIVRRTPVTRRIAELGRQEPWLDLILEIAAASRYTVGRMFAMRVAAYGPRTFLRVPSHGDAGRHSWLEVASDVDRVAKGLLFVQEELGGGPFAILSENRYEMAVADLACLTTGLVNVMVPAHSTDLDVEYILGRMDVRCVVVSTATQLKKVLKHRAKLPKLERIVTFSEPRSPIDGVLALPELVRRGARISDARLEEQRNSVSLDDLASIMVTSGTTGKAKGIRFTQRSLVSKRFARGLALPEIGDRDVFLAYLPLFHTFGRYLELLGCMFWGATYVFMEDHSREGLLRSFELFEPSVFISIPLKWIQLHEEICRRIDVESASDAQVLEAARSVIGPKLAFGLSAAGYLPADIFRFFQRQGAELMSGFGMTEATGGITMTPPGKYRDDTLGVALPGIELKLEADGELLMRGPYVTVGYVTEDGDSGLDDEGWLRTGDLMRQDPAGFYVIVDRKKEIYKNIKGETIAPQRIENLFRDFEAVSRVFLVGDHREYNTLLIVANPDEEANGLAGMSEDERQAHFRSLVVSVNSFLAPFERIVDFKLLERDFDAEQGELTPKGTFRRKKIAETFGPTIETLYRRTKLHFDRAEIEIIVPNWVYQILGLTAADIVVEGGRLNRSASGDSLAVDLVGRDGDRRLIRIGSCCYRVRGRHLDLGAMISAPALWIGNEELVAFSELDRHASIRQRRAPAGLEKAGRAEPYFLREGEERQLGEVLTRSEFSLAELHLAAKILGARDERKALEAVRVLEKLVKSKGQTRLRSLARAVLRTASNAPSLAVRRRCMVALLPVEEAPLAARSVRAFLGSAENLLDDSTVSRLCQCHLSADVISALVGFLEQIIEDSGEQTASFVRRERIAACMKLLADYGAAHPAIYKRLRWSLARIQAFSSRVEDRDAARVARNDMREGFRRWLGPPPRIAVDPETGEEYCWDEVITFEEGMLEEDVQRLLGLIRGTSFVLEAVFLFSGRTVQLSDIPLGGIWISLISEKNGKAVFRLTVHTRLQGSYDIAVNLNRDLSSEVVSEEILWLIAGGEERDGLRLVEDFGGYWRQYDLWSEEFVSGETIARFMRRLGRQRSEDAQVRHRDIWPNVVWNAAEAYLDFWERTGRRFSIADSASNNVIVPTHDFQVGPRIVSVTNRSRCTDVGDYLVQIWRDFVFSMVTSFPWLVGVAKPDLIFSALLEVVGVEEGLSLLDETERLTPDLEQALPSFTRDVRRLGFVPKRLHFAIERYHRWSVLVQDATPQARARMVRDLAETYNIASLLVVYPAARVRFFRETVLEHAPEGLRDGLDEIMNTLRSRQVENDELIEMISALRHFVLEDSAEEYFLTRLTYPHLRPGDRAELFYTEVGGTRQADVLVVLLDHEGNPFRVRAPVNPKEVGRLHRLFLSSKLDVTFRPEHLYLVAVNLRGDLIGGIFYELDAEEKRAHLEKIVVVDRVRKLGISDGLMNELFSRLRASGIHAVTTGFFRPSYFYRFGFTIEKGYAGLVKDLLAVEAGENGTGRGDVD